MLQKVNRLLFPKELERFQPKEHMYFQSGSYHVKLAETPDEVFRALRLRYEVFYQKFLGRAFSVGLDVTPFDAQADHLLVFHETELVGTYRLISSKYTRGYFSLTEFDMGDFLRDIDPKVELSRACVHPDYRTGAVLSLLWKAIIKFTDLVKAKYLFGCASISAPVRGQVFGDSAILYKKLVSEGLAVEGFKVKPLDEKRVPHWEAWLGAEYYGEPDPQLPPLIAGYLKMGARVYGEPAYDSKFGCVDFFTVLKLSDMNQKFRERCLK
jgi:putative hemolysin